MVYKYEAFFLIGLLVIKCDMKESVSCLKEAIVSIVLVVPFKVIANVLHQIASENPCNYMIE